MEDVVEYNIKNEAKLIKMKALKESNYLSVGDAFTGYYFEKPEVGYSFVFYCQSLIKGDSERFSAGPFQTSTIEEIIDECSFRTKNSIYHLLDKSTERNIIIEDLLK
jgi:hypothetical protein